MKLKSFFIIGWMGSFIAGAGLADDLPMIEINAAEESPLPAFALISVQTQDSPQAQYFTAKTILPPTETAEDSPPEEFKFHIEFSRITTRKIVDMFALDTTESDGPPRMQRIIFDSKQQIFVDVVDYEGSPSFGFLILDALESEIESIDGMVMKGINKLASVMEFGPTFHVDPEFSIGVTFGLADKRSKPRLDDEFLENLRGRASIQLLFGDRAYIYIQAGYFDPIIVPHQKSDEGAKLNFFMGGELRF